MGWNTQPTDWEDCHAGIFEPDANSYIAVVLDGPDSEAHTNLIASAPELLAALEDVISSSDANCGDSLANAIEAARSIVAKAKGAN